MTNHQSLQRVLQVCFWLRNLHDHHGIYNRRGKWFITCRFLLRSFQDIPQRNYVFPDWSLVFSLPQRNNPCMLHVHVHCGDSACKSRAKGDENARDHLPGSHLRLCYTVISRNGCPHGIDIQQKIDTTFHSIALIYLTIIFYIFSYIAFKKSKAL